MHNIKKIIIYYRLEPKKNYKLYLKATQIQSVLDKIDECIIEQKSHAESLTFISKKIEMDEKELKEKQNQLQHLCSIEKVKDLLMKKQCELAWKRVMDIREELNDLDIEIETVKKSHDELAQQNQNKEEFKETIDKEIRKYQGMLDEKSKDYEQQHRICTQLKTKYLRSTEELIQLQCSVDSLKQKIELTQDNMNSIVKRMPKLSEVKNSDIDSQCESNSAAIMVLVDTHRKFTEELHNHKAKLGELVNVHFQLEEDLKTKNLQLSKNMNLLRQMCQKISTMNGNKMNTDAIYGEHVSQVLAQIQIYYQAGKFNELPIGPIGKYVSVPNAKYRDIVELQLRGILQAFIVSCKRDCLVFEEILKKFPTYKPPILTTKFLNKVYNVESGTVHPPRGTTLLMNEIQCSHPMVMNCLIDRIQVEAILVAESKDIAEQITANIENVPRNLNKVLLPQHGLEYYPEPNYRLYSVKVRPARLIQVKIEDSLRQMEEEKQMLKEKIKTIQENVAAVNSEFEINKKARLDLQAEITNIESELHDADKKINDLQSAEYSDVNDLEFCKKELSKVETEYMNLKKSYKDEVKKLKELESTKNKIQENCNQKNSNIEDIKKEINNIGNKLKQLRLSSQNISETFRQYQQKLQTIVNELTKLNKTKMKLKNKLKAEIEEASKTGECISTESTIEEIQLNINELNAKLRQAKTVYINPKQLENQIKSKTDSLKKSKFNYQYLKEFIEILTECLSRRSEFVTQMKATTSDILEKKFTELLKLRNYTGSIKINHEEETLDVCVTPRDGHIKSAIQNTKALSGGERSFTTIAFLLTIWSCVDHSFYFLDEYDVFTDEVNRNFMTRLLIEEGEKNPHRQYMFLTPQGMDLDAKEFIKIHKLPPPKRN